MMHTLAKVGFQQSYTLLHLAEHASARSRVPHRAAGEGASICGRTSGRTRPTSCTSTCSTAARRVQGPGGAGATLSPSWGVYSGYELCEHVAVGREARSTSTARSTSSGRGTGREGRQVDRALPDGAQPDPAQHPALHHLRNIRFHRAATRMVATAGARGHLHPRGTDDIVIVVVTIDPHAARETAVHLDMPALGMGWADGSRCTTCSAGPVTAGGSTTTSGSTRTTTPPTCCTFARQVGGSRAARPRPRRSRFLSTTRNWYRKAVFYEVLVRAFADSNGSGSGDFTGLISKLDYIQWLGVDCLWMPRSTPRRCATAGTTSATTARCRPSSEPCPSSPSWSPRRTPAASA